MKIELTINAPYFKGFYNTTIDDIIDYEIKQQIEDYINTYFNEKDLSDISIIVDDIDSNLDYKLIYESIAKNIAEIAGNELIKHGLIESFKFDKLWSPKEYNYHNDSIDINIILNEKNQRKIRKIIRNDNYDFDKYLKTHYTESSGYIPFISNDVDDWAIASNNFKNFDALNKSNNFRIEDMILFCLTVMDDVSFEYSPDFEDFKDFEIYSFMPFIDFSTIDFEKYFNK